MRELARARWAALAAIAVSASCLGMAGTSSATVEVTASHHHHHHQARTWRSGAFSGYGTKKDRAFGRWRHSPITSATDYMPEESWKSMQDPTWAIEQWSARPKINPVLSIPLWPQGGGSLKEAAAGEYDPHFITLAKHLVHGGLATATLRIGWEFNGTWYRWSVLSPDKAALYAKAWRTIVRAIRTVKGERFGFDWNPSMAPHGGLNPALSYPGNKYVTDIGLDVYDIVQHRGETAAHRWHDLVHDGYGMAWQAQFAKRHHKPIAFPEWALYSRLLDKADSGGDDPLFIRNMYHWFASHNTAYENYFDSDTVIGTNYSMTKNNLFPKARATYIRLWRTQ